MPLFLFILIFYHTYIHTVYSSVAIRRGSSLSPHCWSLWEKPPWGAEPTIELWPALQQIYALPIEFRPTLLNYAAPLDSGMTGSLDARIRKCQAEILNSVTQNGMTKTWGESASQIKYCGIHTLQGTKPTIIWPSAVLEGIIEANASAYHLRMLPKLSECVEGGGGGSLLHTPHRL
jgi:hypothetical protein